MGNAAYLTIASGFLCTDVLVLRGLLMCGYVGLVGFHALHPRPLRIPLGWSAFFVLVNAVMAAKLMLDRVPPQLTEEEEELHIASFAPLNRKQFKMLLSAGEHVTYADGTTLTQEHEHCPRLYYIISGTADMYRSGKHRSWLERGAFPNSMSFLCTGWDASGARPAYGTIRCSGEVKVPVWESKSLLSLLDETPDMKQRMDHVVIEAIIRRLLNTPDGAVSHTPPAGVRAERMSADRVCVECAAVVHAAAPQVTLDRRGEVREVVGGKLTSG